MDRRGRFLFLRRSPAPDYADALRPLGGSFVFLLAFLLFLRRFLFPAQERIELKSGRLDPRRQRPALVVEHVEDPVGERPEGAVR